MLGRLSFFGGLLVVTTLAGCGAAGTSYSVESTAKGATVTLHNTKAGDIKVDLTQGPGGGGGYTRGNGTTNGTEGSGDKQVSYEIKYSFSGTRYTIESVRLDGQEISKAMW